jgi:hypothetical protein
MHVCIFTYAKKYYNSREYAFHLIYDYLSRFTMEHEEDVQPLGRARGRARGGILPPPGIPK